MSQHESTGSILRRVRRSAGLSQSEAARRTGVSLSTISRHERGDLVELQAKTFARIQSFIESVESQAARPSGAAQADSDHVALGPGNEPNSSPSVGGIQAAERSNAGQPMRRSRTKVQVSDSSKCTPKSARDRGKPRKSPRPQFARKAG